MNAGERYCRCPSTMDKMKQRLSKASVFFLLAWAGVGCASSQRGRVKDVAIEPADPTPASALVFESPLRGSVQLDLDREYRQPVAFVGFQPVTSTFFYIRTDDRQRFTSRDFETRFERRAISEQVGVRYR